MFVRCGRNIQMFMVSEGPIGADRSLLVWILEQRLAVNLITFTMSCILMGFFSTTKSPKKHSGIVGEMLMKAESNDL